MTNPHFYNVRLSERDAWFGTTVAVIFNALGMLLDIGIIRSVPGVSEQPAFISSVVGLLLLIVLLIRRKTPSLALARVIFLINSASVAVSLGLTNLQFAAFDPTWVPFQAIKLGCLIPAMVAPEFWVGLASILAYALTAVFQLQFSFSPETRSRFVEEPWAVLAFALAGILALVYRFRRAQLEHEMARVQAQNFALTRMAGAFLNIRDFMNTPLQVIELSVALLRNSKQPPEQLLERIDRSLHSLREINSVLVEHEKNVEWQPKP